MRKILIPLLTSVLFSGSYVAGKYTTVDLGPLTTTLLRYVVALAFLCALIPYYGLRSLRLARRDIIPAALLGLFGIVGYHYFFFSSLALTQVANTAIINALSPVLTALAAALFIGERLAAASYAGVLVACAGVLALVTRADASVLARLDFNRGDLLMLLSVLCWVAYALLVRRMVARYSSFTLTFHATFLGVVALVLIAPAEAPLAQLRTVSAASIVSVLYMGIGASGLGYLLYNLSIREIGPTRTSSFVYGTVAIVVAVLAWIFFAEAVTPVMAASAALIVLGLRLMLTGARRRQSA